jgi:hypothetical protein
VAVRMKMVSRRALRPAKKLKPKNPFGNNTVSGTVSSPSVSLPDADLRVHSVD